MAVTRIGSLALFQNTFRNLSGVQATLGELQKQVSSGIKAQDFRGLNGQVEQFTFLEGKMRQTTQFIQNNQINVARLKTADQALSQMIEITDQLENIFVQRQNGAASQHISFVQQVKNMTDSIVSEVNVKFDGRSLFGGTNTADLAVTNAYTPPAEDGVPDDGYYGGSKTNVVYRADERIEFDFPVRADDPAFQKLFAAVNMAIKAHDADDYDGVAKAVDMLQAAQADLNTARARVNSSTIALEQINERHNSTKLYIKGVTEEISKTDVVGASIEIANNQAILQAGFQAFSRLQSLRLVDFLR